MNIRSYKIDAFFMFSPWMLKTIMIRFGTFSFQIELESNSVYRSFYLCIFGKKIIDNFKEK